MLTRIREVLDTEWTIPRGRNGWIAAFAIGAFVGFFLLVFQPFGVTVEHLGPNRTLKVAGYALISFVCAAAGYVALPRLFPAYFAEGSYTILRDAVAHTVMVALIGVLNYVYMDQVLHDETIGHIVTNTFMVGILIYTICLFYNRNRILQHHIAESQRINSSMSLARAVPSAAALNDVAIGDQELALDLNELLFMEAAGNYVKIVRDRRGGDQEEMVRTTLKEIEAQLDAPSVMRCHRSFVVNLGQVGEVSGNAQGIRLGMKSGGHVVPVSRSYVPAVREYFSVKEAAA